MQWMLFSKARCGGFFVAFASSVVLSVIVLAWFGRGFN